MNHGSQNPHIVVADDDPEFLKIIAHHIRSWSFRVDCVRDKTQLFRRLAESQPDLMFLDVRFGEFDGLEVLRQVLGEYANLKVVMLTAFGSIDNAISAMKLGAVDYLTKPVDLVRLRSVINAAYDRTAAQGPSQAPSAGSASKNSRPILGSSRAIREMRAMIERIAPTESTVLVLGESGTGKELVARAIHEQTEGRRGPFVALNVAALPRELVESTLFGHAKGAFTGADQMQRGCCEAADGGTLFLDEIGEMEIGLQAKLLRFLQERSFHRVGESQPISVDVRIIAATHRNPLEQVRRGLLREDLYYRLNVIPIVVPPLRDRLEDIPILAQHFVERWSSRAGRRVTGLSPEAISELMKHTWPGNIRELENLIERLAILSPGPLIQANEVRAALNQTAPIAPRAPHFESANPADPTTETTATNDDSMRPIDRIEYQAISEALAASNGNVREAAKRLGLGQATVYRKIKKYNLI